MCHFTAMYPLFAEVCRRQGVQLQVRPSIGAALSEHWAYLRKLNGDELKVVLEHVRDHHE